MLLSNSSSLFYPPSLIKPSTGKYFTKTKFPPSSNHPKIKSLRRKNDGRYSSVIYCCQPPTVVTTTAATEAADHAKDVHEGIGILEFFEGKNIFVTGATGLLGKVVVEKLLRSTWVGKVYVLVKAKDKKAAFDRFKCEITDSDLFKHLKEEVGDSYEALVREKLMLVHGNILEPNFGMDNESLEAIRKNVDVIIHSAAITNFNERYDLIVDANVIAPHRLMRFAKTCTKLQLFTHISTAYVNEKREGIILEKPLIMGETTTKHGELDVADEISLLLKSSSKYDHDATKFYRKLGQQRAEEFGWSTTYQLSKAMGEMVLNEIRGDVPLLIIRPAIIEGCYNEPVPGWIRGIRTFEPLAISYGKGLLPGFFANPQAPLAIIPVDFVANTTIAAIAKHGKAQAPQINVYNAASGLRNPLTYFDAFEYLYEYFQDKPLIESAKIAKVKFFDDFEDFSKFTREEIFRNHGIGANGVGEDRKKIRQCNAKVEYAQQLCKMYEFATFFDARFDTGNTQKLIEGMSMEEQVEFEVDVNNISWKNYMLEIYMPGVKRYLINSTT